MENYTDKELKEELGRRGYITTALWHIDDVQNAVAKINLDGSTDHVLDDFECMEILEKVFGLQSDFSAEIETLEYAVFEHLQEKQEISNTSRRGR